MPSEYQMLISRMTVDKLGVKLYDRVYAVLAELISNSYDADATEVIVRAPMGGQYLAYKHDGKVTSKNSIIEVEDNGIGMTPEELQDFYLVVGLERRSQRGGKSRKFERAVMGRKGVGKLAPFGVCRIVEIISAGGEEITEGAQTGYKTAHIILDKDKILSDTTAPYNPDVGPQDRTLSDRAFTKVILREFYYRKIGTIQELSRQLAQRFGIESRDWRIRLVDTQKTSGSPDSENVVGAFDIQEMPNTKISFTGPRPTLPTKNDATGYTAVGPDGNTNSRLSAGFLHEAIFYPVVGWVAYAKTPYKDELMAGIRIYCRGKFAAQTSVFNRKAGFTGEHSIRSYLIGELHADWLDEDEDLIQTDRRDILWSQEIGEAFQEWGQGIIQQIGYLSRDPMRQTMLQKFFEIGQIEERITEAFPSTNQRSLRETATQVATLLGKSIRAEELDDRKTVDDMVQLTILLAPIQNLDEKLREAADTETPLHTIIDILKTARLAETVTFGHQVLKRIDIINHLESLKDNDTPEEELQKLIESAPWLINPQWVPITANQALTTLKEEFEKFFKLQTGLEICLTDFTKPAKRPDFVSFGQDNMLQLIEIKKPKHVINDNEWERIQVYFDQLEAFFNDPKHTEFKSIASDFHVTLVCDGERLTGSHKKAFKSFIDEKKLTLINWSSFLLRTKKTHSEFLEEAERLKKV